jgi:hypothetical protein
MFIRAVLSRSPNADLSHLFIDSSHLLLQSFRFNSAVLISCTSAIMSELLVQPSSVCICTVLTRSTTAAASDLLVYSLSDILMQTSHLVVVLIRSTSEFLIRSTSALLFRSIGGFLIVSTMAFLIRSSSTILSDLLVQYCLSYCAVLIRSTISFRTSTRAALSDLLAQS